MTPQFLEKCLNAVLVTVEHDSDSFYRYESSIQFLLAKEIANESKDAKVTIEQDLLTMNNIDRTRLKLGNSDILIYDNQALTAVELKYYAPYRTMKESEAFHCLKDIKKVLAYTSNNNVYQKGTENPIKESYCVIILQNGGIGNLPDRYRNIFSNQVEVNEINIEFEFESQSIYFDNLNIKWHNTPNNTFKYCILHNQRNG